MSKETSGVEQGYAWKLRDPDDRLPFCMNCQVHYYDNQRRNFPCIPSQDYPGGAVDPLACAALDRTRERLYFQPQDEELMV
jgi:hypothetical protein